MPRNPKEKGVLERHIRIPKDKYINNSLEYMWSEALKTTIYIPNKVPNKFVPKTPFELYTRKENSTWTIFESGVALAEVKIYNPLQRKTYPKTRRFSSLNMWTVLKDTCSFVLVRGQEL